MRCVVEKLWDLQARDGVVQDARRAERWRKDPKREDEAQRQKKEVEVERNEEV